MKRTVIGKVAIAVGMAALVAGIYLPNTASAAPVQELESAKQSYLASIRAEAIRTNSEIPSHVNAGTPSDWLTRVDASKVNMVTNRVEEHAQNSVDINGRSYSVASDSYARTLKLNPSLRLATDPITGKKIDKSEAQTFADASGKVFYFANDSSFKSFLALGTQNNDTVFGYSEAK